VSEDLKNSTRNDKFGLNGTNAPYVTNEENHVVIGIKTNGNQSHSEENGTAHRRHNKGLSNFTNNTFDNNLSDETTFVDLSNYSTKL